MDSAGALINKRASIPLPSTCYISKRTRFLKGERKKLGEKRFASIKKTSSCGKTVRLGLILRDFSFTQKAMRFSGCSVGLRSEGAERARVCVCFWVWGKGSPFLIFLSGIWKGHADWRTTWQCESAVKKHVIFPCEEDFDLATPNVISSFIYCASKFFWVEVFRL